MLPFRLFNLIFGAYLMIISHYSNFKRFGLMLFKVSVVCNLQEMMSEPILILDRRTP